MEQTVQMSEKGRNNRNEEYFQIIRQAVSQIKYGTVTIRCGFPVQYMRREIL